MTKRSLDSLVSKHRLRMDWLRQQEGFKGHPARVLARLAAWRLICAFNRPATVDLKQLDIRLVLPPEWRGCAKLIYAFREKYEPEVLWLSRYLRPGQVVVDGGASIGIYSLLASKVVGDTGLVLAFEPAAQTFRALQANVAANGGSNVQAINSALADRTGPALLALHSDPARHSLAVTSGATETIDLTTLDHVVQDRQLQGVDFIKLDVEGAEELVLMGAMSTLKHSRPVVMFEVNSARCHGQGLRVDGAWTVLQNLGYEFWGLTKRRTLVPMTSIPTVVANVVAMPARERSSTEVSEGF